MTIKKNLAIGVLLGTIGFAGYAIGKIVEKGFNRVSIPIQGTYQRTLEESYVKPSKLELLATDLNFNGESELLLKYDGVPYLFQLNDQGQPTLSRYDLTPRRR